MHTSFRMRLFEIIERGRKDDKISRIYDYSMVGIITLSLIPLMFKTTPPKLYTLELICAIIFSIDYILRWITADFRLQKKAKSFLLYPFTPFAILDLLSILPVFIHLNSAPQWEYAFNLLRILRVIRAFRAFRYLQGMRLVGRVFKRSGTALLTVCVFSLSYVLICALIIFSAEPSAFPNFFDAFYWAATTLTTVGYGDIIVSSPLAKILTILSSIVGIGIVALPAGILTAGFMHELHLIGITPESTESHYEEKNIESI